VPPGSFWSAEIAAFNAPLTVLGEGGPQNVTASPSLGGIGDPEHG
jgi:hypothetical protein